MAMRGDDILGVRFDPTGQVKFLKGEVKSRATLGKKTVDEARTALSSTNGRPTPHALAFVADRLFETGETALAEIIDKYQLKARIEVKQLSHLMFTGKIAQCARSTRSTHPRRWVSNGPSHGSTEIAAWPGTSSGPSNP